MTNSNPLAIKAIGSVLCLTTLFLPLLKSYWFDDPYTVVKWICVYSCAVLVAFSFLCIKKIPLPRFPIIIWIALVALCLLNVGHLFFHNKSFFDIQVLDRLSFVILFFGAFTLYSHCDKPFQLLSPYVISGAFITLCIGIFQFHSHSSTAILQRSVYSAQFGNINMAAQFIGFSILFIIFGYSQIKDKFQVYFFDLLIVMSFYYLYYTACRSVLLSLFFAIPVLLFKSQFMTYKKIFLLLGITYSITLIPLGINPIIQNLLTQKTKNMSQGASSLTRLSMWSQTLHMISDYPLGIGPNRFEFRFIPYASHANQSIVKESLIMKSPHNEFLRILSEDGIPAFLLLFFFLAFLLYRFARLPTQTLTDLQANRFVFSFFIFWFVESCFQFPLENAFPFYIFILMIAFVTYKTIPNISLPRTLATPILVSLLFTTGILAYRFSISKFMFANRHTNETKLKSACLGFPENWKTCIAYGRVLVKTNKLAQAEHLVKSMLDRNKYTFPAIDLWRVIATKRHDELERCEATLAYDALFNRKSNLSKYFNETCQDKIENAKLTGSIMKTFDYTREIKNANYALP